MTADALRYDLAKITENFAVDIELVLVLPNKADTRTTLAEEYREAFRTEYPDGIAPITISGRGSEYSATTDYEIGKRVQTSR